jgi:uncharacterized protein (DUF58 family)
VQRFLNLRNALLVLLVVLFLVAWNRGIALLYGLFALVLAVLLVSLLAPRFTLRHLSAERRYPVRVNEDESLPMEVTLRNGGWLRRYLLELVQAAPGGDAEQPPASLLIPALKGVRPCTLQVPCERRGCFSLPPLQVRSGYPLGIAEAVARLCSDGPEILVYPTPFTIGHFPYVSGAHMPLAGVQAVALTGGTQEYVQVRDYQAGDSPRHIHWPQTARQQTLMVREYEFLAATEVTLLLDLQRGMEVGEGKHTNLEYAVKIAASIARHACAAGHRVRLLGYGAQTLRVPAGGGRLHDEAILEALARVQADGDLDYQGAKLRALAEVSPGSVMVLFHSAPDTELPTFYARHVKPVWIRFDTDSFRWPVQVGRRTAFELKGDMPVYTIRRGDDLTQVFGAAP